MPPFTTKSALPQTCHSFTLFTSVLTEPFAACVIYIVFRRTSTFAGLLLGRPLIVMMVSTGLRRQLLITNQAYDEVSSARSPVERAVTSPPLET